ncbi:hypothetical protein PHSY_007391 [Pseudozyma hubeiensis SY62]|uniref:Uncharacterized protein n=1 Tax=Pseudozyma hubeiensis (strain SY62) TaxID=1305764 RepID=R9PEK0_PSEHS|nr:hypothetical protein PHSY_007391 [Pseudozyma hubeiensis SY62]GAC99788.1 hypothetical protein PHSY_007391 [Pseudozyma hubeiensis SY62]
MIMIISILRINCGNDNDNNASSSSEGNAVLLRTKSSAFMHALYGNLKLDLSPQHHPLSVSGLGTQTFSAQLQVQGCSLAAFTTINQAASRMASEHTESQLVGMHQGGRVPHRMKPELSSQLLPQRGLQSVQVLRREKQCLALMRCHGGDAPTCERGPPDRRAQATMVGTALVSTP